MSADRLLIQVAGVARAPAELPRAGALVIGSDPKRAGVLVEGPEVDAAHCVIGRAKGGGWALRDLQSRGGTFLNGKRVQTARLAAGDVLLVGGRELRILDPEAAVEAAALPSAPVAAVTPPAAPARPANVPPDDETRDVELETPLSADLEGESRARAVESQPATLPVIIGYSLERALGRGGMGQVYLAVQESLARKVALKVLAPRLAADAEFVRRFQAEARSAAALNHPNVVTVYDVGEHRGVHFLSMEFMDRGNLEERVARGGRFAWREVLDILRDAALGLAFAESRGIVHRDLKPANLMQNSAGQTKIADLGLATHVETEDRETAERKVFGTPHFMAPEQARGERVDSRSDLYSLGATGYRLLTAHTPFEGANAKEIVRAHLKEDPRPLRAHAPDVPEAVEALISRLMRKEPAQRYQTATELVRELERLRASGNDASAASRARERSASGGRRRALAWLVILAAVGGAGWWYLTGEGAPHLERWKEHAKQMLAKGDAPNPVEPGVSGAADPRGARPVDPADGPAAVTPRNEPETNDGPKAPKDDDAAEQLAEAKAKLALMELEQRELSKRDRRDELRLLAVRHRGTTVASEAEAKAEELAAELARDEQTRQEQGVLRDDMMTRMRAVAGLDKEPPEPGKAILALRALGDQQSLAADPQYLEARKQIELEITENATRWAERVLAQYDALAAKGDFETAQKKLEALMPVLDMPDFAIGEGPAGVSQLMVVGRTARERLKTLELTRVQFTVEKTKEDTRAIAVTFGGPDGFEKELRTLDLRAARARLEAVAPSLTTEDSRVYVKALAQDVERAQAALEMIAREYPAWKRKSITDPRGRKGVTRNAVGASAEGLLCEQDGGQIELVGWASFGGNTRDLAKLFNERLGREYTPAEVANVAALLRITAVIEAIDLSVKMLDPTRKVNFTEANARELLDAYAPVTSWAQRAGDTASTVRELDAATQLVHVLEQVTAGAWSVAVAGTERLLATAQGTLLVRLLSDGNLQLTPPAPAEPVDPNPSGQPVPAQPPQPPQPTDPPPRDGR